MQQNQRKFLEEQVTLFSHKELDFNGLCESIRTRLDRIQDQTTLIILRDTIFTDEALEILENIISSRPPLEVHLTNDNEINVRNENNDYIYISNIATGRVIINEGNQIQLFEY